MNDPCSTRSKRAKHTFTFRKIIMYLKSSGKVEFSWEWSETFSAITVYVLIRSDRDKSVRNGMIYPDDFVDGLSLHFNSTCTQDCCTCPKCNKPKHEHGHRLYGKFQHYVFLY
ncbi:hypothetical protein ACJMK2_017433 [Sinanodonta woodiana]|uniref:Uncharacterized protein n=1 Tax=Sinanodonta woodiana TaxID=1069815 RepID=A0ABD3UD33_SINWO